MTDSVALAARQALLQEVTVALLSGTSGERLVDLIIRTGWQPGPEPHPQADQLHGALASGKHVPITIRPAVAR